MAIAKTVKLKLRHGDREIEVEGTRAEVDELLKSWWTATAAEAVSSVTPTTGVPRSPRSNYSKKAKSRDTSADAERPSLDLHNIAMKLKEDERFPLFENEILHGADQWRKICLVMWYVDQPLTSGQIQKILDSLDVRITLPNLSTVLKRKSRSLISDQQRKVGGRPANYRLTSKAKSEFETSLKISG